MTRYIYSVPEVSFKLLSNLLVCMTAKWMTEDCCRFISKSVIIFVYFKFVSGCVGVADFISWLLDSSQFKREKSSKKLLK